MARTYLSGDNSRGNEVTAMGGSYAHYRGWRSGVRVQAEHESKNVDRFAVYMTGGSNGGSGEKLLGHVTQTAAGPVWEPREDTAAIETLTWMAALTPEDDDNPAELLEIFVKAARKVVGDQRATS